MKTYVPKQAEITRRWWIVDAEGMTLGRLATEVAVRLRGKHKPTFTPHMDCGDNVIVVNAEKVKLTGRKTSAGSSPAQPHFRHMVCTPGATVFLLNCRPACKTGEIQ